MKILLSAYACEPNKGSEPGVGWNWALEIANRGHEVIVITRNNNRNAIEDFKNRPKTLTFIYYDLPKRLIWLKKLFGIHAYYLLWQIGIYFKVKRELNIINPDIIHHITFVAIRKLSFLALLGKPFYYGPLGGGESCPKELLRHVKIKDRSKEVLRNITNGIVRYNLFSFIIFSKSKRIFTTTDESKFYINKRFHKKTFSFPAIGVVDLKIDYSKQNNKKIHFLYVGNFIYWKGLQIALEALSILNKSGIDFAFTIVGKGDFDKELKKLASTINIDKKINWINWLPQKELAALYESHDIFLFPSLHDSGGMVVLEAISHGLPVVCLDLGGPGHFVTNSIGYKIDVSKKKYETVVSDFAQALLAMNENRELLKQKSETALKKTKDYSWSNTIEKVYSLIENDFQMKNNK